MKKYGFFESTILFLKGFLLGTGFIVPGISGGALALVFGIYRRAIDFLSDIRKNFKRDFFYFLPIGIGMIISVVIMSYAMSFLLGHYEKIVMFFFIGCVLGTLPSLLREASLKGRNKFDILSLILSFTIGVVFLENASDMFEGKVRPSTLSWTFCGALIALGALIPGLSPSNFIVYMGLYKDMADGFKVLDFGVIIPMGIGAIFTILLLTRIIKNILKTHYSRFYHIIIGIVLSSTFMIIPRDYTGFTNSMYIMCIVLLLLGTALGFWMSKIENLKN